MGSGKSTVGPLVAESLCARFVDLDEVIVERAGRSIPAIFEEEGEAGFRRREAEALQAVSREAGTVIVATGGGTLVQEENLQHALRSGTIVYLRTPAATLAGRLEAEAPKRPLLQAEDGQPLSGQALAHRIEHLLAGRRSFYERAHLTVRTDARTPRETAAAVAKHLRKRGTEA